jgi:hypothetical protein
MTKLLALLCVILTAVACSGPATTFEPTDRPRAAPTAIQAEEQPTAAPTAARPTPQPTQDTAAAKDAALTDAPPGSIIRLDSPAQQFTLSDAQRTLPEGILREVGYFSGGGGGGYDCRQYQVPAVAEYTAAAEWHQRVSFVLCGFGPEETFTTQIISPQGEVVHEKVETVGSFDDAYSDYIPELGSPLGVYTARFSGTNGSAEQTFDVIRPDGPRVYGHDGRIVLFQFQPNETIRLYAYEPTSTSDSDLSLSLGFTPYTFSLWNEFVTDAQGQLIIEGFSGAMFAVVGKLTGEVQTEGAFGSAPTITSRYPVTVMRPTDEEMNKVVDLWTLTPFHDLDQPGEQKSEVTVSAADPVYWRMRWCAVDRNVLEQNLGQLSMSFLVNGHYIDDGIHLRKTEEAHPNTGWACHRWGTLLKDFPTDEPTILEIAYELREDVNDGKQVYPAGVYRQVITVHATSAPAAAGDGTGLPAALPGESYAPPPAEWISFEPTPAADVLPPDNVSSTIDQLRPPGLFIDEPETANGPLIAAGSPTTLEPAPDISPEFWLYLYVLTCAWPQAREYVVTIEYPDGRTELDSLNVDRSTVCEPYTHYLFDAPLGTYTIQFGTYENMRHSIEVVAPSGPRLYVFHEGNQGSTSLLLHNFAPNENVRVYEYRPDEQGPGGLRLAGWQALQIDGTGQLLIGTRHCRSQICMSQPGAYIPTFVVVGDTSGEVHEFDQLAYRAALMGNIIEE